MPPDDDVDVAVTGTRDSDDAGEGIGCIASPHVNARVRGEGRPEPALEHATIDDEQVLIQGGTADAVYGERSGADQSMGDTTLGKARRHTLEKCHKSG